MKLTIKKWIYDKAQESAGGMRTLCWDTAKVWTGDADFFKTVDFNDKAQVKEFVDNKNWADAYCLYGEVTKETEKAVLMECKYWDLRFVHDVSQAKLRTGWKVWVPKSAIYEVNGKPYTGVIPQEQATA